MHTTHEYTPPPLPPPFHHHHQTTPANPPTLLTQGAEAHLYKTHYLSAAHPAALKIRPSKPYRHPILDRRLTRQRILQEARCLAKLVREGVSVPALYAVDWEGQTVTDADTGAERYGGAWLLMEWVEGDVVRVVVREWEGYMLRHFGDDRDVDGHVERKREEDRMKDFLRRIGGAVGKLHAAGVIHGDLTTSNLILRGTNLGVKKEGEGDAVDEGRDGLGHVGLEGEVVLIDFGLAGQSVQDEDRAVDLYVLERAFGSTHPRTEGFFAEVLEGYRASYRGSVSVLKRLEEVRMRGRKKSMLG
ncbi:serine/threonine protein kinase BUD32 [Aspergillus homomorphus CBS 101889]|uniref:EKC/KEOPS complex subunit BUD32 n=1 Tax=Aspergillus homomorphus (strain CBS 101889) TaxID=1450537 RepID=A0A395HP80_ASPHC|nr:kinase-like protein [Aspergillus homomorphus CBS 101889]RAL09075.1 kinase-like protein [Aspergillus homomorphus CBS 101889]